MPSNANCKKASQVSGRDGPWKGIAMKKLPILAALLFFTQTSLGDINSELIKAATEGQTDTLKALIRGGADVQSDGGSALMSAAYSALERQLLGSL